MEIQFLDLFFACIFSSSKLKHNQVFKKKIYSIFINKLFYLYSFLSFSRLVYKCQRIPLIIVPGLFLFLLDPSTGGAPNALWMLMSRNDGNKQPPLDPYILLSRFVEHFRKTIEGTSVVPRLALHKQQLRTAFQVTLCFLFIVIYEISPPVLHNDVIPYKNSAYHCRSHPQHLKGRFFWKKYPRKWNKSLFTLIDEIRNSNTITYFDFLWYSFFYYYISVSFFL